MFTASRITTVVRGQDKVSRCIDNVDVYLLSRAESIASCSLHPYMRSRFRGALRMMLSTRSSSCESQSLYSKGYMNWEHTSAASEADMTTARLSL